MGITYTNLGVFTGFSVSLTASIAALAISMAACIIVSIRFCSAAML